jgi:ABC-type glycerol-3-phosphate transport system substrate-binding protein
VGRNVAGLILAAWLLALAGCEGLPWGIFTTAPTETLPIATLPPTPSPSAPAAEGAALATSSAQAGLHSNLVRVWLPPQFDPEAGTPAGLLLRQRLDQFMDRYPDLRLEIRIKAESGPGGLLAALSAASASAPLTLPDVVALPRPLLETAALKGVIYPMDGLPVAEVDGFLTETDWYPYAVQMGRLQENTFGLPFAGDLLVMVSQTALQATEEPLATALQPSPTPAETTNAAPVLPASWAPFFETRTVLSFPGADPHSLFTLALYRSLGGQWIDAEGRPILDAVLLEQVLALYQVASQAEVLPYWLSQYETDEQAWEVFASGEAGHIIAWASQALAASSQAGEPLALEPIPTLDPNPYSLAQGWVWAVASPNPERRALAGELAAFLVESSFLAEWNAAAGTLPPRASAVRSWEPATWRSLVEELSAVAELLPPGDALPVLGPLLRQATVDVLKLQAEPGPAAEAAASALKTP